MLHNYLSDIYFNGNAPERDENTPDCFHIPDMFTVTTLSRIGAIQLALSVIIPA